MGYKVKLWDITLHTVPEVEYDGRWHMYDNSMSALYTLCDSRIIAAVEDIGKDGSCPLSDGRTEPGHIARYHCLNAGSNNGFLTGADCPRDLEQEFRCFKPSGLKFRYYYNNWDRGHRYILNLRDIHVTIRVLVPRMITMSPTTARTLKKQIHVIEFAATVFELSSRF